MVEPVTAPARRSPFQEVYEDPAHASLVVSSADRSPSIAIKPRLGLTVLQVDCRAERAAKIDPLMPGPGEATSLDGIRLLNIGPTRWLAIGRDGDALTARIQAAVEPAGAAVVDQTHGRAILRLSGPAVRDVLSRGTGVDLHPRVLAEDCTVQTALFHVAVTLDRRAGSSTFDLHVARGYAQSVFERLIEVARPFGVQLVAADGV